jgi:7,8-dihydroneopterin aldolase/epimerase/oxygenase
LNSSRPVLNMPWSPPDSESPQAMDLIFIEGLTCRTVIGIHASELHQPQTLVIDVHAGVARARACSSDAIVDTIDYSAVRERLRRLMREHQLKLLEALAEAIADIVLDEFGAQWVRVQVVKPRKFDDVDAVGVRIERRAEERASALAPVRNSANVLHLIGAGMVPGAR